MDEAPPEGDAVFAQPVPRIGPRLFAIGRIEPEFAGLFDHGL